MIAGEMQPEEAFAPVMAPFRVFMEARVDPGTVEMLREARAAAGAAGPGDRRTPLSLLVPAFLLSEIKRGFEVGFLIFLPFLVIDLVIAAVLMSMGMMMVPPAVVSLPFKLAFFVIADGWSLLAGALVRSYAAMNGPSTALVPAGSREAAAAGAARRADAERRSRRRR